MFPETKGVDSYKDITPRMGVAYDLFGNGKTALKVNLGKYLEGVGVPAQLRQHESDDRPLRRRRACSAHAGVTRTWIDANNNFQPDCDLLNRLAQDLRGERRRLLRADVECALRSAGLERNYDPDLLNGWGVRPSDWSLGVSVQQQISRGCRSRSAITAAGSAASP